jgi:hypothetical protein
MVNEIRIDGKTYQVDDFSGRELVAAERGFGINLMPELDAGTMQGVYALIYLVKHRENPDFTVDDALDIKIGQLNEMLSDDDEPDEGEAAGPPTPAPVKGKRPAAK